MPKANYLWISPESFIIVALQITHHGSSAQGPLQVLLSAPGWHSIQTFCCKAKIFFISRVLPFRDNINY